MRNTLLGGVSLLALTIGFGAAAQAQSLASASVTASSASGVVVDDQSAGGSGGELNTILNSFTLGAEGVLVSQQNNGDGNVLGSAIAVNGDLAPDGADIETVAAVTDIVAFGSATAIGDGSDATRERQNFVQDSSYNGAAGIIHVQQNNGDINAMGVATAAHGIVAAIADVGAITNTASTVGLSVLVDTVDQGTDRRNRIRDSFDSTAGIMAVQQNNGSGNAMGIANAVTGLVGGTAVLLGSPEDTDAVTQSALTGGTIALNTTNTQPGSFAFALDRNNVIRRAFDDAVGLAAVQQNNGDGNAMGIANAIAGITGGVDGAVTQDATSASTILLTSADSNATDYRNLTINSADRFSGVLTAQQNNGDGNAISNANAVLGLASPGGTIGSIDQTAGSFSTVLGSTDVDDIGFPTAINLIERSFRDASGVLTVQQNNGHANAMDVANAVIGATASVGGAISQTTNAFATLDGFIVDIDVSGSGADRSNDIDQAFTDAAGVVTVQQNNGHANAIQVASAIAGDAAALGAGLGGSGSITQAVTLDAEVDDVEVIRVGSSTLDNNIGLAGGSFNGATGVLNVQQNNGSGNAIVIGNAIVGIVGATGAIDQDIVKTADILSSVAVDPSDVRSNLLEDGFNGAAGVANVQQNNGDANIVSIGTAIVGVASSTGAIDQDVGTTVSILGNLAVDIAGTRDNFIADPVFDGFTGVASVQQNNGSLNAMDINSAVVGVTGATGAITQTPSSTIELTTLAGNLEIGIATTRTNTIAAGAFDGASGIINVQQNNGDLNSLQINNAVVGALGVATSVTQDVNSPAIVAFGATADLFGSRTNTIPGGFAGATGIANIEQNNGTLNTLETNNGVVGSIGPAIVLSGVPVVQSATSTALLTVNATLDLLSDRSNTITGAFTGAAGIANIQQNNGDLNALQINNAVLGATAPSLTGAIGGISQVAASDVDFLINLAIDLGGDRENTIDGAAFAGANGIAAIQQNNGSLNSMDINNAVVGSSGGINVAVLGAIDQSASSTVDAALNAGIDVDALGFGARDNSISGSAFSGAAGLASVQQNNGDLNSIDANSAVVGAIGINLGLNSTVDQSATSDVDLALGATLNLDLLGGGGRDNVITGTAFSVFDGIANVQQNNGDLNALGINNAVMGAVGISISAAGATTQTAGSDQDIALSTTVDFDFLGGSARSNVVGGAAFALVDGVVNVQQNNGDLNAMGINNAIVGASGAGVSLSGTLDQSATSTATLLGDTAIDVGLLGGGDRLNTITGIASIASDGIVNVQQNNGDLNSISANTAVFGTAGLGLTGTGIVTQVAESDAFLLFDAALDVQIGGGDRANVVNAGAFLVANGITTVQQNNGNVNVMGVNSAVVGVAGFGASASGPVIQTADSDSGLAFNVAVDLEILGGDRTNTLTDLAFTGANGIVNVQQNNGDLNAISTNNAVVGVSAGALAQLGFITQDASSTVVNAIAAAIDIQGTRTNTIDDAAFAGGSGIASVQQNNGNLNSMDVNNAVVGANGLTLTANGLVDQDATSSVDTVFTLAVDGSVFGGDRTNTLTDGAFAGFAGVVNVQQNNGDLNAISANNAVIGGVGASASLTGVAFQTASSDTDLTLGGALDVSALGGGDRDNTIDGAAFATAAGVINAQQNNGNINALNINNAVMGTVGLSASATFAIVQSASSLVELDSNTAIDLGIFGGGARTNDISDIANVAAAGLLSVQQNNGDVNALSINNAVSGTTGIALSATGFVFQDATSDVSLLDNTAADVTLFFGGVRDNDIDAGAFAFASGIVSAQQNNGDINAMGINNAVVGVAGFSLSAVGFVDQEATSTVSIDGSFVVDADVLGGARTNSITDAAFLATSGLIAAQQNNGNVNSLGINNAVVGLTDGALAIGADVTQTAMSEVDLTANGAIDILGFRTNTIDAGSFNGISGMTSVQQNNGDVNALDINSAVVGVAGGAQLGPFGDVTQVAGSSTDIIFNLALDADLNVLGARANTITDDAFEGVEGVTSVQQNNGNVNGLGINNAIIGVGGFDFRLTDSITQTVTSEATLALDLAIDLGIADSSRDNLISDEAFEGAAGLTSVQQNNGDINALAINNAVVGAVGLSFNATGTVVQSITSADLLALNAAFDINILSGGDRENLIDSMAFAGSAGVVNAQQNNGNINAMTINNAIVGVSGLAAIGAGSVDQSVSSSAAHVFEAGIDISLLLGDTDTNTITGSAFSGSDGVATVQQNNGDLNSITANTAVLGAAGFALSAVGEVDQVVSSDTLHLLDATVDLEFLTLGTEVATNTIDGGAFSGSNGIATVQQNNGNLNAIGANSAVVGLAGGVLLQAAGLPVDQTITSDADIIATLDADIDILISGETRTNLVGGTAFSGSAGIANVQQNNGNLNAMQINNAVLGSADGLLLGPTGTVTQTIGSAGTVAGNLTFDLNLISAGGTRTNTIGGGAFTGPGTGGIATVQQNNGDVNVMTANNAIVGSTGFLSDAAQEITFVETVVSFALVSAADDVRTNRVEPGAFDGFAGVVDVQQNNGDANVMIEDVAVLAYVGNGPENVDQTIDAASGTNQVSDLTVLSDNSLRLNDLTSAFVGYSGVATIQQNNGDGNVLAAATALVGDADDEETLTVDQTISLDGVPPTLSGLTFGSAATPDGARTNLLVGGAFDDASGIVTAQQNNGGGNFIFSGTAVFGSGPGATANNVTQSVDMSVDIEDIITFVDTESPRLNTITDSFDSYTGTLTVQQNNGDGNAMFSAIAVSADVRTGQAGATPAAESSTQSLIRAFGTVSEVDDGAILESNLRDNDIVADSFDGASGVVSVQQNNGTGNVIGTSIGVVALVDADDIDTVASVVEAGGDVSGLVFGAPGDRQFFGNRSNFIDASFDGAEGIFAVFQNNGNGNVATTAIGVSATLGDNADVAGSSTVSSDVTGTVGAPGAPIEIYQQLGAVGPDNTISDSFESFQGVATVTQNNGDANVLGTAVSVGAEQVGSGGAPSGDVGFGTAVSTATLAGATSNVTVDTVIPAGSTGLNNTITDSFNGAAGVVSVTQNNGSGNVISSSISVTASFTRP